MVNSIHACSLLTYQWLADSPLSSSATPYLLYLNERGYAESTVESYLKCVAHFAHWMITQKTSCAGVNEALITRFINEHLPVCRCASRCHRGRHEIHAALGHLLTVLESEGYPVALGSVAIPSTVAAELEQFDRHLDEVRGLATSTRASRLRHIKDFLIWSFGSYAIHLSALSAVDVMRFINQYTVNWTPASIRAVNMSLRSYFAFRTSQGEHIPALSTALPRIAQWRLATLPSVLSSAEVEQLLSAFDRQHPTGKRDYAITRCLLDLGLRRTEVARLRLDDVDWQTGTVSIQSKGRRIDVMPLPERTGRAIARYLLDGRPDTTRRELFVRHRPPINAPVDPDIVRNAIRNAAKRCGLEHRIRGTHVFRHTLAARLVKRGARFKEVADLLRHQHLDTTTIYAKVDINALVQVALPWPRRLS